MPKKLEKDKTELDNVIRDINFGYQYFFGFSVSKPNTNKLFNYESQIKNVEVDLLNVIITMRPLNANRTVCHCSIIFNCQI